MQEKKDTTGLTLIPLHSEATPIAPGKIETLDALKETIATHLKQLTLPAYFVAYLEYKVVIGKYKNGELVSQEHARIEPKYLKRLRVFNEDEELLVWRSEGAFKGRFRRDNVEGAAEVEVIEAHQVLFGTQFEAVENEPYTTIFEERGTRLTLPFKDVHVDVKNNPMFRARIKTRNYIGYNDLGQAGYEDCRFVSFTDGENDLNM